MNRDRICCPVCWRDIDVRHGFVARHVDSAGTGWCPMSNRRQPRSIEREALLEKTAQHVMSLACELRDDLESFYSHLNLATDAQVRDWLVIALAAVDINRPISQLLAWVEAIDNFEGAA
jgi:hypothetical protein